MGACLWDGALVLAAYLLTLPRRRFFGMRCVELGAGVGTLGIIAAKLGSHVRARGVEGEGGSAGEGRGQKIGRKGARMSAEQPGCAMAVGGMAQIPPGSSSPTPPTSQVVITDIEKVLPLLNDNLAANGFGPEERHVTGGLGLRLPTPRTTAHSARPLVLVSPVPAAGWSMAPCMTAPRLSIPAAAYPERATAGRRPGSWSGASPAGWTAAAGWRCRVEA